MNVLKKEHLLWVDMLKGIAIFLVVFNHSFMANNVFFNQNCYYLFNFINYIHIPIFFFISGFFIFNSTNKPLFESLKAKFNSLFYPYIVWSLIFGLMYLISYHIPLFQNTVSNKISITQYLLFFVKPFSFLWFLFALFFTNVIYLITRKFLDLKFQFIIAFLIAIFLPYIHLWPLNLGVSENYIFFITGLIFRKLYNQDFLKTNKLIIILMSLNFLIINYTVSQIYIDTNQISSTIFKNILINIGVLSGLFSITYFAHLIQNKDKLLGYIGSMSLYIYLFHPVFVMSSRAVLKKIDLFNNIYMLTIIPIILGIIFSIYFYKLINKINAKKQLFGR